MVGLPRRTLEHIESIIAFAQTPRQNEVLNAILRTGSQIKAAVELGIDATTVRDVIERVEAHARRRGWNPPEWINPVPEDFKVAEHTTRYDRAGGITGQSVKAVPEGALIETENPEDDPRIKPPNHYLKGVSTYVKDQKEITGQWFKTDLSKNQAINNALESIKQHMAEYKGAERPLAPPEHNILSDYATIYAWGDPHIGMLAHHLETGNDFDINIATKELKSAMDTLVWRSMPTDIGVFVNVGDFFHADNDKASTPMNNNRLDVDSRIVKVSRLGFDLVRWTINRMREKHKQVIVFNAPGNHDPMMARMLNLWLESVYEDEPNVTVEDNANPFMYWRFGKCLIGINHGDGPKPEQLPLIMVDDRKQDVGETDYRLWITGHIHHLVRKEYTGGFIVESFRTMAARDYWHHWKGYRADRSMQSITVHKKWGEYHRDTMGIKQVQNEN